MQAQKWFYISLLVSCLISEPNYVEFYRKVNEAETLYLKGDINEAKTRILDALNSVKDKPREALELAASICTDAGDYNKACELLRSAFKIGLEIDDVIKQNKYSSLLNAPCFTTTKNDYADIRNKYMNSIHVDYSNKLDSLYYIDQFVLRNSNDVPKRRYQVDSTLSKKQLSDSAVFAELKELISKYGFPTGLNVRKESLRGAYVIIHHNARHPKNAAFLDDLHEFVLAGKYHPFWYAWAYDQRAVFFLNEKPKYFIGIPGNVDTLSENEKEVINKNRAEIGLYSLELERLRKKS